MKSCFAIVLILLLLSGCSGDAGDDFSILNEKWSSIEAVVKGSSVNFYMNDGHPSANRWVDTYVSEAVKDKYGITLVRVPFDTEAVVAKFTKGKEQRENVGSVDLVWINGENFKAAREADIIFGPFAEKLPNYIKYVNKQQAAYDFGNPVEGYEVPIGWTQFVFEYDSVRTKNIPKDYNELLFWVKANPGRFTYPRPPAVVGSAFIRQAFYAMTGGPTMYLSGWDRELFEKEAPKVWSYLNEMKPYLWRQGKEYPKDIEELDALFAAGQIDFGMSYLPLHAQSKVLEGQFPDTVRTFVLNEGTLYNHHFAAIPKSCSNKAGAMVVANFLLSPEAQLSKYKPDNWGDYPAINLDTLSREQWTEFMKVELGDSSLSPDILSKASVPEVAIEYLKALETGWEKNVR